MYTPINDDWSAALHHKEFKSYIAKGPFVFQKFKDQDI